MQEERFIEVCDEDLHNINAALKKAGYLVNAALKKAGYRWEEITVQVGPVDVEDDREFLTRIVVATPDGWEISRSVAPAETGHEPREEK